MAGTSCGLQGNRQRAFERLGNSFVGGHLRWQHFYDRRYTHSERLFEYDISRAMSITVAESIP